jgi:hypothetical protein
MEVTPEPQPGEDRLHAALQMMVTFSSDFTIKIPTKEISKVWFKLHQVALYLSFGYYMPNLIPSMFVLQQIYRTGNTMIQNFRQFREESRCGHSDG